MEFVLIFHKIKAKAAEIQYLSVAPVIAVLKWHSLKWRKGSDEYSN
jgi:hypothetical protein